MARKRVAYKVELVGDENVGKTSLITASDLKRTTKHGGAIFYHKISGMTNPLFEVRDANSKAKVSKPKAF